MAESVRHHGAHAGLVRRLRKNVQDAPAGGFPHAAGEALIAGELSISRYTSQAFFDAEQSRVFSRTPQLVAHESELPVNGACLPVTVMGVPVLLMRGDDGVIRAFKNACRHRGTQLVSAADPPCKRKAVTCPYHAWTYDLRGSLIHVPHAESFAGKEAARTGLQPVHVEVRHGLCFVQIVQLAQLAPLAPLSAAAYLGGLDQELLELGLPSWTALQRSTREVRGNWKLIVDAFLDGYHIRHLHRDTVYRFFIDAAAEAERVGPHIRAVTARRALRDVEASTLETVDLRQLVTPSHVIFPNVILIFHPDYTSVVRLTPLAPDLTRFEHTMLVPHLPRTDDERAHWEKSFRLIDEGVFAREDLTVVEAMQRGFAAAADDTSLFGDLEKAALWFHESLDEAMAVPADPAA